MWNNSQRKTGNEPEKCHEAYPFFEMKEFFWFVIFYARFKFKTIFFVSISWIFILNKVKSQKWIGLLSEAQNTTCMKYFDHDSKVILEEKQIKIIINQIGIPNRLEVIFKYKINFQAYKK